MSLGGKRLRAKRIILDKKIHFSFYARFPARLSPLDKSGHELNASSAVSLIGQWRKHYNTVRPHSSLGYRPPAPQTMNPFLTPLDQAAQMQ
jgi:hypothetical protein